MRSGRAGVRIVVALSSRVAMLRTRQPAVGTEDGPVFPDRRGGYRDRNNVGRAFREVRAGTEFAWVKTHTYRRTVATVLDGSGTSARMIADQLGHARISTTQDVYMGRRTVDSRVADALDGIDPSRENDGAEQEDDGEAEPG
ncbi:MAG: tyrosine-type recombinase/integrase [Dermatophilaceae bacterium]